MLFNLAILPLLISLAGSAVGVPMDPSLVSRKEIKFSQSAADHSGGNLAGVIKAALQQAKQAAAGPAGGTGKAVAPAVSTISVGDAISILQQAKQGEGATASQAAGTGSAAAPAASTISVGDAISILQQATQGEQATATSAAAATAIDSAAAVSGNGDDVAAAIKTALQQTLQGALVAAGKAADALGATAANGTAASSAGTATKGAKQVAAATPAVGSAQCNGDRLNIVPSLVGAVNAVNAINSTNPDTAAAVSGAQAKLISAASATMTISFALIAGQKPPSSAAEQIGNNFADAQTALQVINDPSVNAALTDARNNLTAALQAGNAVNRDCDGKNV